MSQQLRRASSRVANTWPTIKVHGLDNVRATKQPTNSLRGSQPLNIEPMIETQHISWATNHLANLAPTLGIHAKSPTTLLYNLTPPSGLHIWVCCRVEDKTSLIHANSLSLSLMSSRIFNFDKNKIFKWAPITMREIRTPYKIWNDNHVTLLVCFASSKKWVHS